MKTSFEEEIERFNKEIRFISIYLCNLNKKIKRLHLIYIIFTKNLHNFYKNFTKILQKIYKKLIKKIQ